jgi:hypothetical protein
VSREDMARIWSEAFPSLPPATLDYELRHWISSARPLRISGKLKVATSDASARVRRLADADVYAIRAMLRQYTKEGKNAARGDVTAALALEPTNVMARLLRLGLDDEQPSLEVARATAAAHGDDWRAWMLVAQAVQRTKGDDAEVSAARSKACALIAANPALHVPPSVCSCP